MEKVFIKDKQGNKVLPITHVSAVLDDEGNDLGSHLGNFEDEVRGLVDTPHQEYVTVATYASLPASGSKDTIYRVSNYDGSQSQVAADVYSEYAWDGTQYVFLCVKSQIGEVFDISAYHNNATYADLNAALTGNTGGVPSSLQKGGMSVKFVQSYDNKYVQYRYRGTETTGSPNPFLDTANWQGVDAEVVVGSKNLVEGVAVAKMNSIEIMSRNITFVYEDIFLNGAAPDTDYLIVELNLGTAYTNIKVALATEEAQQHITTQIYDGIGSIGNYAWKVPYNGERYVRVYVSASPYYPSNSSFGISYPDAINRIFLKDTLRDTNIQKNTDGIILSGLQQKRLLNPTRKVKKPIALPLIYGQIYLDGDIQTRKDGMRYEEIIVSPTAFYWYTGTSRANDFAMVIFYDKNGNKIASSAQIIGNGSNVEHENVLLTVPENAFSMRAGSFIVSGLKELQITVEDYADKFVETYGTDDLWAKSYNEVALTIEAGKNIQVDGTISTFSTGGCSQLITIDKTKKYKVHTNVDQYCCGAVFYSDNAGTVCVGFQVTSYASLTTEEVLDIPSNAVTMRVGSRDNASEILHLYEIENKEAAPLSVVKDLQQQVNSIDVSSYIRKDQGPSNYGKVLVVGADGMVIPGSGGGSDPTANSVVEHISKQIYLGADIIDNPDVILGSGWSGSLANGFTHTPGSTDIIEIQQATTANKKYLVECTLSVAEEASIFLSIGNGPLCDVYNSDTTIKVGFISDGGYLKITPASSFSGIVSNISIKELVSQESAVETIAIDVMNIENGTMVDNISGFWNVVLGTGERGESGLTMSKCQNGSRNIVAGYAAMGAFESGTRNVMLGTFAGSRLKEGDRNIAIGADAFWYAQTGRDNIAIGYASMGKMEYSQPSNNIAIGSHSLGQLQNDASDNIAIGQNSCNYGGKQNVGIGVKSCYWSRGDGNTAIGYMAQADPFVTGNNNIAIGKYAQCGNSGTSSNPTTISNAIAIGYNTHATKSNQVVIGNSNHTEFVLGNKKLVFNNDNTVTWETIS